MFSQSPYYAYSTPSPVSRAYAMPPHGFSAMLSPGSPMLFGPPHIHGMPSHAAVGETTPQGQATPKLACGEAPASVSLKPRKYVRKKTSAKEIFVEGEGSAPKRGRISEAKANMQGVDDDQADKKGNDMWKDFWVEHLVHIRGGMNNEFNKMPKQGVDLWGKVATKLASMFSDCDKDAEACRKKWARVNKQYREDKAHNAISGNDRKRSCKWYDVVDEYMHDRANVVCKSHASALGEDIDPSGDAIPMVGKENIEAVNIGGQSSMRAGRSKDDPLHQMAESGRELVSHMKEEATRRAVMEERRQSTFEAMQSCMAAFLEYVKEE